MEKREVEGGGSRVKLTIGNTGRLSGLNYKLVCYFILKKEMLTQTEQHS